MLVRTIPAFLLTGVLIAVPSVAATAQTKPAAAAPQAVSRAALTQKLDGEFKEIDSNKDGFIAKTEVQAAFSRRVNDIESELKQKQKQDFDKLDTNKDGKLTLAEYQAGTTISPKAGAADQRLAALDANKDGKISPTEYQAPMLSQFDKLDSNKDGSLSPTEQAAAAPRK
jgi:Ca2+-binding EF-hand superfamily protein